MKDITEFLKNFNFGSDTLKEYSDVDRLELLGIDDSSAEEIKKLEFKKVNFDENDYEETIEFKIIQLDTLVGINRNDNVCNWIELLFSLHKKRNFDIFNRDSFEKYVKNLDKNCDDLPHVLHNDEKYFIDRNGKHRLTFAKCIGLKYFPAIVTYLKK